MIGLTFQWKNLRETIAKYARLRQNMPKIAGEEVGIVAKEVSVKLAQSISTPYPGASAPGNPPHRRTGHLMKSVSVIGSGLTRDVGTGTPYARYLEEGTSKMAARPHVGPMAEGVGEILATKLAARIHREL